MLYNYMDHVLRGSEFIRLVIFFELCHILRGNRNLKIHRVFVIIKKGEIVGVNDYMILNFDDNKPYKVK